MVVRASRGLGRGIATALAESGARILAVARSGAALAKLASGVGTGAALDELASGVGTVLFSPAPGRRDCHDPSELTRFYDHDP